MLYLEDYLESKCIIVIFIEKFGPQKIRFFYARPSPFFFLILRLERCVYIQMYERTHSHTNTHTHTRKHRWKLGVNKIKTKQKCAFWHFQMEKSEKCSIRETGSMTSTWMICFVNDGKGTEKYECTRKKICQMFMWCQNSRTRIGLLWFDILGARTNPCPSLQLQNHPLNELNSLFVRPK